MTEGFITIHERTVWIFCEYTREFNGNVTNRQNDQVQKSQNLLTFNTLTVMRSYESNEEGLCYVMLREMRLLHRTVYRCGINCYCSDNHITNI